MLTTRERQVFALIGKFGNTNMEIGAALGCTERTIKVHVSSLLRKRNVSNRVQLALDYNGLLKQ